MAAKKEKLDLGTVLGRQVFAEKASLQDTKAEVLSGNLKLIDAFIDVIPSDRVFDFYKHRDSNAKFPRSEPILVASLLEHNDELVLDLIFYARRKLTREQQSYLLYDRSGDTKFTDWAIEQGSPTIRSIVGKWDIYARGGAVPRADFTKTELEVLNIF